MSERDGAGVRISEGKGVRAMVARGVTSTAGPRAPCDSYNIVIAMTVITSRKVFLHNQHYSQFRGEWATGNRAPEKTGIPNGGSGDGGGGG